LKKFLLLLIAVTIFVSSGYYFYQYQQKEAAKQQLIVEAKAKARKEAKILAPFTADIVDLAVFQPADLSDRFNFKALNEEMPNFDEVYLEIDSAEAVLYMSVPSLTTDVDEDYFQRTLFYVAANNFVLVPSLQQLVIFYSDQTFTIDRSAVIQEIQFEDLSVLQDSEKWKQHVIKHLLDQDSMKRFVEATHAREGGLPSASELSRDEELLLYLYTNLGIQKSNLHELDFDFAKEMVMALEKIHGQYPDIKGYVTVIEYTDEIADDRWMEMTPTSSFNHGGIAINKSSFADLKSVADDWQISLDYNFSPKGTSYRTMIVHEMAHALEAYLVYHQYSKYTDREPAWDEGKIARELVNTAYDKVVPTLERKVSQDRLLQQISEYAFDGGPSEALAEAFHDVYDNGNNAHVYSLAIVDELNARLKEISEVRI